MIPRISLLAPKRKFDAGIAFTLEVFGAVRIEPADDAAIEDVAVMELLPSVPVRHI